VFDIHKCWSFKGALKNRRSQRAVFHAVILPALLSAVERNNVMTISLDMDDAETWWRPEMHHQIAEYEFIATDVRMEGFSTDLEPTDLVPAGEKEVTTAILSSRCQQRVSSFSSDLDRLQPLFAALRSTTLKLHIEAASRVSCCRIFHQLYFASIMARNRAGKLLHRNWQTIKDSKANIFHRLHAFEQLANSHSHHYAGVYDILFGFAKGLADLNDTLIDHTKFNRFGEQVGKEKAAGIVFNKTKMLAAIRSQFARSNVQPNTDDYYDPLNSFVGMLVANMAVSSLANSIYNNERAEEMPYTVGHGAPVKGIPLSLSIIFSELWNLAHASFYENHAKRTPTDKEKEDELCVVVMPPGHVIVRVGRDHFFDPFEGCCPLSLEEAVDMYGEEQFQRAWRDSFGPKGQYNDTLVTRTAANVRHSSMKQAEEFDTAPHGTWALGLRYDMNVVIATTVILEINESAKMHREFLGDVETFSEKLTPRVSKYKY